jgi:hypothetical protein
VLEVLQVGNARAKGWSWQDIASRLGVRLLVEARGVTLEALRATAVGLLDRDR